MTRDEHKIIINELFRMATPENQARMSEYLTTLSEDYEHTLTDSEASAVRIQELTENNERLRDVNSKLFLQVGKVPEAEPPKQPTHTEEIDPPNISIDSLFNDKGELI